MRPPFGSFFTVLAAGSALCVAVAPSRPVEAGTNAVPSEIVRRVFSPEGLPGREYLAAFQNAAAPQTPAALPDGKGKDLALKYCVNCHAMTAWTGKHYSEDQWAAVLDNMVSRGLNAPDDDLITIGTYLVANFGPAKTDAPAPPPAP